jgi:hypothetical protein
MDAQPDPSRIETFTVKEVRKGKDGVNDGRAWSTYLIFTDTGEMFSSFEADWLLMLGQTVTVPVTERVVNGKTYRSVKRPPSRSPGPAVRQARSAIQAAHRAQGAQTALAVEPAADTVAAARLEATLEQVLKRVDSMAALAGDTAESVRALTVLLQQRLPISPEEQTDEADVPVEEPDSADPGPPEPPKEDAEPEADPYDV